MARDQLTNTETRLEPRLMKLLCLLAAQPEQLVTRDRIIKEIWNDYGGADEGLNQAISFLRKTLHDAGKELIKTVPKKGYILHATVTGTAPATELRPPRQKRYWLITAALVTILLAVFIFWQRADDPPPARQEPPGTERDTTYQYKEIKEQERLREAGGH